MPSPPSPDPGSSPPVRPDAPEASPERDAARAPERERSAGTPLRRLASLAFGWLADRRLPRSLRPAAFRAWARATGSDLSEARLPLDAFPSLSAFFVRELRDGVRTWSDDPAELPSPVDGIVQAADVVREGTILQAKGQPYAVHELVGALGDDLELEGGSALTLYLSPRDYHRIHCPVSAELVDVAWIPGARYSVRPGVLARKERVLAINERVVLRLSSERGPCLLVFVGALNVGRIRVVGVAHGEGPARGTRFERGDELGRFELGSTVIVLWPRGVLDPASFTPPGNAVRLGAPIARFTHPGRPD